MKRKFNYFNLYLLFTHLFILPNLINFLQIIKYYLNKLIKKNSLKHYNYFILIVIYFSYLRQLNLLFKQYYFNIEIKELKNIEVFEKINTKKSFLNQLIKIKKFNIFPQYIIKFIKGNSLNLPIKFKLSILIFFIYQLIYLILLKYNNAIINPINLFYFSNLLELLSIKQNKKIYLNTYKINILFKLIKNNKLILRKIINLKKIILKIQYILFILIYTNYFKKIIILKTIKFNNLNLLFKLAVLNLK